MSIFASLGGLLLNIKAFGNLCRKFQNLCLGSVSVFETSLNLNTTSIDPCLVLDAHKAHETVCVWGGVRSRSLQDTARGRCREGEAGETAPCSDSGAWGRASPGRVTRQEACDTVRYSRISAKRCAGAWQLCSGGRKTRFCHRRNGELVWWSFVQNVGFT